MPLLDLLGGLGHRRGPAAANRSRPGGPRPAVGALPADADRAQHAAASLLEEVLLLLNGLGWGDTQTRQERTTPDARVDTKAHTLTKAANN